MSGDPYNPYGANGRYYGLYRGCTTDRHVCRGLPNPCGSQMMSFTYDGKVVKAVKIQDYKRAQKHVLDLYPDLSGIAAYRVQFYVMRPSTRGRGHSTVRHNTTVTPLKSYISEDAWPSKIDALAGHETVGIEIRESTDSVVNFFNRF